MNAGRHVDDARPVDDGRPAQDAGVAADAGPGERPGEHEGADRPRPRPADDSHVLPSRSSDDLDTGWGDRPRGDDDERFLRDVPPHWGR